MNPLYNVAWTLAAPPLRWWLGRAPAHRPLIARFAPPVPAAARGAVWVHACSVGEVNTALPLLRALREAVRSRPLALSASTAAGHARACAAAEGLAEVLWFPFDGRSSVRGFLDALDPAALVLVETELWPNAIGETHARGAPVCIVNGRIGDARWPRYRRHRRWFAAMLGRVDAAGVQSARHAERFAALGLPPGRIAVTGNLKFDGVATAVDKRTRERLRAELGIPPEAPVLVFGSTRPGEEALASACWATLREEHPALRLVVAPRHLDRAGEIPALFGEPVLRRSEGARPQGARVILLDTHGELAAAYALADAAVVGGSFYPGPGGHNPLEPAALGVPTVFGPHMENFLEAAAVLCDARGAVQPACPEDLYPALSRLLADPAEARRMGTRARGAVLAHQGAAARNAALVAALLEEFRRGAGC